MIKLITDIQAGEPDIMEPYRRATLCIHELGSDEASLEFPAPEFGWNHEILRAVVEELIPADLSERGCDAYLDSCWIGSTEV